MPFIVLVCFCRPVVDDIRISIHLECIHFTTVRRTRRILSVNGQFIIGWCYHQSGSPGQVAAFVIAEHQVRTHAVAMRLWYRWGAVVAIHKTTLPAESVIIIRCMSSHNISQRIVDRYMISMTLILKIQITTYSF